MSEHTEPTEREYLEGRLPYDPDVHEWNTTNDEDDENVNPDVYRVEDGHTFEVSPWPSMEGKCHLCDWPEHLHIQATS